MNKKQKTMLWRIITAAVLMVALHFVPVTGLPRFALYMVPYLIVGYDILKKAALGIWNRQVFDENFLMAVATVGAIILGLTDSGDYTEAIAVMLFYQTGELFQSYAVGKSRRNISELMDIRPDYANIEVNGQLEQVDPDEVEVGTVIVVQPGEKVPIDGVVVEGRSTLNTAALTGESLPREVAEGGEIISGCINLTGLLKIRTTKEFGESTVLTGESLPREVAEGGEIISGCINLTGLLKIRTTKEFGESTVSKILDLVENASSRKSKSEAFISKFAKVYTPAVCFSAVALALLPPLTRQFLMGLSPDWADWLYRALTFLVISCPCALVISIPLLSFFAGIGGASNQGVLVKGSNYLETLAQTRTLVFDKTGTLTEGVFEVTRITPAGGFEEPQLLELAALAESASSHPISKSLQKAYGKELDRTRVGQVEERSGAGVVAEVDGRSVAAGNDKLMNQLGVAFLESDEPGTVVHIAVDGVYAGQILIADRIKPGAAEAIAQLKNAGVRRMVMLTGDHHSVAEKVAGELGLDEYYSELLPSDKVTKVEELLAQNTNSREKLAFVGDGINDAPVLSRADIGIAMGAMGSDAAIEAADVVLMDDDPRKIAKAIKISRKCLRIVYQNTWFAIGVKLGCLLLGALGIANMWLAIFADVGVMVLAVLNAIRALFVKDL